MIAILTFPVLTFAAEKMNFVIHGVEGPIKNNIEARLNAEKKSLGENPDQQTIRFFYRDSKKMVRQAISPFGYFNATVKAKTTHQGNHWTGTYTVTLGQPVLISDVDLTLSGPGQDNPALQRYMHNFPIKKDTIFNANTYNQAKEKFLDIANNEGYLKAEYTDIKVLVNTSQKSARIIMHMDTGDRYYFGRMLFSQSVYDPAFMNRFNIFKCKPPFSSNRLVEYQQEMNDSGYFSQVIVMPDLHNIKTDHEVPIHVSVIPPKSYKYTLGLGYGTFTGPRLTAGFKSKRVTDTGHSFDAQLKLSSVLSGLSAKYFIPGYRPLNEQWSIGAGFQAFAPKNGTSNSRSLTGGYSYKSSHWTLTANLNYLLERYSIESSSQSAAQPSTNSQVLYPSVNIGYVKTDNLIRPTTGISFNTTLQGASKTVLSSTSFLQGEVKGKYLLSPVSFAKIIARADVGYTVVNNLDDLPLSLRFFAGGITSIRGFPDSSIGPGRYLEIASLEYRNRIVGDWDAAVFYDVGNATNHFDDPLNRAVGVGIVYNSIIGPVRLYLAQAISKPDKPYQVEFSLGPEF